MTVATVSSSRSALWNLGLRPYYLLATDLLPFPSIAVAAFALDAILYCPVLTRPRLDGKPR